MVALFKLAHYDKVAGTFLVISPSYNVSTNEDLVRNMDQKGKSFQRRDHGDGRGD